MTDLIQSITELFLAITLVFMAKGMYTNLKTLRLHSKRLSDLEDKSP